MRKTNANMNTDVVRGDIEYERQKCNQEEIEMGSRSEANQDRDGECERGQDRGEGSVSGENQGRVRNAEGSGSRDDEDECERRVKGDIECKRQECNQEEIEMGSRSEANQDRDGEGERGQYRGGRSVLGENQGRVRNAERRRQVGVMGDIRSERRGRINSSKIPETFMGIIAVVIFAAVDFHGKKAISSTILSILFAINVFGFFCCMASMLKRQDTSQRGWRYCLICEVIGAFAGSLGLLLLVAAYLSNYYGWIILGLGLLALMVVCVWTFRR